MPLNFQEFTSHDNQKKKFTLEEDEKNQKDAGAQFVT